MLIIGYEMNLQIECALCRQCESNRKFKRNKKTHLTPLFCVVYAII